MGCEAIGDGSLWTRRDPMGKPGALAQCDLCVVLGQSFTQVECLTFGGMRGVVGVRRFLELWEPHSYPCPNVWRDVYLGADTSAPRLVLVAGVPREVSWWQEHSPADVRRRLGAIGLRMGKVRAPKGYGPPGYRSRRWEATVRGIFREPRPTLLCAEVKP
jgi:hypothetical protein